MTALFTGDFELGTLKPWAVQDKTTNTDTTVCHFGTVKVNTATVGQGTHSARFDLPASPTVKTRAQLITSRTVGRGTDDYYTLQFFPPVGFTASPSTRIMEPNFQALGVPKQANFGLDAHTDHVTVVMAAGRLNARAPWFPWNCNADAPTNPSGVSLYAIPPGTLTLGVWHELIVHCHWATDSTGVVEVWHREKGQTAWTKTASLTGHPTLQTNQDGSLPTATHDVIQAYRGPATTPTTLYLDGFTRSTTLAAAQAYLG